jgi:hypothetical protein
LAGGWNERRTITGLDGLDQGNYRRKIEEAFGRNSFHEDVNEIECRKRLYVALNLREEEA